MVADYIVSLDVLPFIVWRFRNTRVPISTRIRSEYAEALKRASLERQLNKQEPNTLQDILEQAIEPWLRDNGYIR
jgi:hypothetical protein